MRDTELLIELLRRMAENAHGTTILIKSLGMRGGDVSEYHHGELLADVGHAEWTSGKKQVLRITSTGYDFLNAIDREPEAKIRFKQLMEKGLSYADVALRVIEFVRHLHP